jgi:hypothetical protein
MLPTLTHTLFHQRDWLYEPKLDGYRVLAFVEDGQVRLRSLGGQEYAEQFPWIVHALAVQPIDTAVFDGELVALGPDGRTSFQRLACHFSDFRTALAIRRRRFTTTSLTCCMWMGVLCLPSSWPTVSNCYTRRSPPNWRDAGSGWLRRWVEPFLGRPGQRARGHRG